MSRVLDRPGDRDSHGCGLPTAKELMARSGGTLEAGREGESYRTVLTFPRAEGQGTRLRGDGSDQPEIVEGAYEA